MRWTIGLLFVWTGSMFASPAAAQRSLGLVLGGAFRAQNDVLASPLRYQGAGPAGAVRYAARGPRARFALTLDLAAARLTSTVTTPSGHYANNWRVGLSGEYLRLVTAGRPALYLGGRLSASGDVRRQVYDPAVGSEMFVDLFTVLEAAGTLVLPIGASSVSETVALPVVSLAVRTPYTGLKSFPSPQLRGPGTLLGFRHRLTYRRPVSKRVTFAATHTFDVWHYPTPRSMTATTQRLSVAIELVLGRRAS